MVGARHTPAIRRSMVASRMRMAWSAVIGLGLALAATMAVAQAQTPGPPRLPGAAAAPSAALSQKAQELAKLAQAAEQQGYVSIIVEFAPPIPHSAMRPDRAVLEPLRAQVRSIQDAIIASHFGSSANPRPGQGFGRGIRRLDISPMFGVNVNAAELEALAADPRVLRIHENELMQPLLEQSVPLVGMAAAYSSGANGDRYAVAVIDTGVKADHPFLAGKVILEACFSKNGGSSSGTSTCPNGQPTQTGVGSASPTSAGCLNGSTNLCYHGTHVAGIATGTNSTHIAGAPPNGVAKSADIVAIQVFTNFNNSMSAYTTDIISGLNYIYSNLNNLPGGIKVAAVNMSLGGSLRSSACELGSHQTEHRSPACRRRRNGHRRRQQRLEKFRHHARLRLDRGHRRLLHQGRRDLILFQHGVDG